MKKIIVLVLAVSVFVITACATPPAENPNVGPKITVKIPELFSFDPDVNDGKETVPITVTHVPKVQIKEWSIVVDRQQAGQRQARPEVDQAGLGDAQRAANRAEADMNQRQSGEGEPVQRPAREGGRANQGPFYELKGEGTPPKDWVWDGSSSREPREGRPRARVQSATDYDFTITVTDTFDNTTTEKATISVGILVYKDAEGNYRMQVSNIVFPGGSSDLNAVSEQEQRANRRVLRQIGSALNRFAGYSITVEGHSNPIHEPGTPERAAEETADQALSLQRAESVMNYLAAAEENAVDASRMNAIGKSCTQPVIEVGSSDYDEESYRNRRVEFILVK